MTSALIRPAEVDDFGPETSALVLEAKSLRIVDHESNVDVAGPCTAPNVRAVHEREDAHP